MEAASSFISATPASAPARPWGSAVRGNPGSHLVTLTVGLQLSLRPRRAGDLPPPSLHVINGQPLAPRWTGLLAASGLLGSWPQGQRSQKKF